MLHALIVLFRIDSHNLNAGKNKHRVKTIGLELQAEYEL